MNERIKELYFMAQGHANEVVLTAFEDRSYDEIVQEKFADLLFREHMSQCTKVEE